MVETPEKALLACGLNKKEAKLYLASLGLGSATVNELAKKSGLKRTTIYSLIDSLKARGILKEVRRRGKKYFFSIDPQQLYEEMGDKLTLFKGALNYLISLRNKAEQRPQVIFYEGAEGFKQLWKDIFASGVKEYLNITSGEEFLTFVKESYVLNKIITKKVSPGIKSRQIITHSRYARDIVTKDAKENRISKIAPREFLFPATEIIFGDKVAIFTGRFENIIMLIDSEEISNTHRAYFEILWKNL